MHYLSVWRRAFQELLGWQDDDTSLWSKSLLTLMEKSGGVVISEPPLYYVARELAVRQSFYDELTQREKLALIEAVEDVLYGGGDGGDFPQGYNFANAKNNIESVFRRK